MVNQSQTHHEQCSKLQIRLSCTANPLVTSGRSLFFSSHRGHNVTFLSGFPADNAQAGLEEITPIGLVEYISNYTTYDLLGARLRNQMPISVWDALRYPVEVSSLY